MKIGYARVSTTEQREELQVDALKKAGCEKIFIDKSTGAKFDRKGLTEARTFVRKGDSFVVWKLDRLGRSLKDLIETVNTLNDQGVEFISLTENIDTTTSGGKLVFHLMAALAEFERNIIRERTRAGLEAARSRGRNGGRPKKLKTDKKISLVRSLYADKSHSIDEICSTLGISRRTLYRYVKEGEEK
jgi:DNA invertase Pin-like site-specific DNA recombinase